MAKLPVSRMLDTTRYPDQQVALVGAAANPVTCAHWSKPAGAATSSLSLLSGSVLPVPDAVRTVDLVGGGSQGTAARVALAPGTGYFTQTVGGGPAAPGAGSLFWVSDTGVRYGIDTETGNGPGAAGHGKTVEALGLSAPQFPSRGRCCRCSHPDRHCRAPTRCSPTTAWRPTPSPVARCRPKEGPDEPIDLRGPPPAGAAGHPQGHHHHRGAPELPRVIPPSLLRRAMPYLIVILIVGMIVALVATGMRMISPQTLFFPFVLLLAATALYRGNDNKMRTEEVDAERADYLRYLSVVRDNIRTQAAQQRAAAEWSHRPDGARHGSRLPPAVERDPTTPTSWCCGPAGTRCR